MMIVPASDRDSTIHVAGDGASTSMMIVPAGMVYDSIPAESQWWHAVLYNSGSGWVTSTVTPGLSGLELSRNLIYPTINSATLTISMHVHKPALLIKKPALSDKEFGYKLCRITQA